LEAELQLSDIGRIVHYRMDGYCVPAMVTKIYPDTSNVDLAIFHPELQQTEFLEQVNQDAIAWNWQSEDGMTGIFVPDHEPLTDQWHDVEPRT
jgi:hypothetical protein